MLSHLADNGGGAKKLCSLTLSHSHNTDSSLPTLSIIIPCFNETQTIAHIIECVQNVTIAYHKEIIIVDDYSTDGTREILKNLESRYTDSPHHTQNPNDTQD